MYNSVFMYMYVSLYQFNHSITNRFCENIIITLQVNVCVLKSAIFIFLSCHTFWIFLITNHTVYYQYKR